MTAQQLSPTFQLKSDTRDIIPSLAFSPDGSLLVTAEYTNDLGPLLHVWDMPSGAPKHHLPLTDNPDQATSFYQLAFSVDGTLLISAPIGAYGITALWDVASGQRRAVLDTGSEALALSSDNRLLACAGGHLRLLDVQSGDELAVLEAENCDRSAFWDDMAIFNHTGTLVATACWMGGEGDEYVRVWDIPNRRMLRLLPIATSIRQIAFAPDGTTLMVATVGDIQTWNVQTGRETAARRPLPPEAHGYGPVAFSPDRRMLATPVGIDQPGSSPWESAGLVDTATGALIARTDTTTEDGFWEIALSSANQLAAVEDDLCIWVWDIC